MQVFVVIRHSAYLDTIMKVFASFKSAEDFKNEETLGSRSDEWFEIEEFELEE